MKLLRGKNSEKGVAMLMALVTLFILSILAGEIVYQSSVFTSVVFRQRDALRATLLARSGLRLALLQLKATKKAKAKAKSLGMGDNMALIDKIWQTPMILPPPDLPGLNTFDTSALAEFRKSLGFEGVVNVTIIGENGRMSLNSMVWPISSGATGAEGTAAAGSATGGDTVDADKIAAAQAGKPYTAPSTPKGTGMTKEQKEEALKKNRDGFVETFNNLLDKRRQNDDAFRDKYPNLTGDKIVGDLVAWMDPEAKSDGEGRDKGDYYSRVEPTPYAIKNAPLGSESELHMIKGMDEVVSKLVSENFTIQSTNSLDVNKASLPLIHALIPDLTPDVLEKIGKRRTDDTLGGPFKNEAEFWDFLGHDYEDTKKKFTEKHLKILDQESSFHVAITAQSGLATKTWLADIGPMLPKVDSSSDTQGQTSQPPPQPPPAPQANNTGTGTSTGTNTSTTADSGDTDSLNIVYLRAD